MNGGGAAPPQLEIGSGVVLSAGYEIWNEQMRSNLPRGERRPAAQRFHAAGGAACREKFLRETEKLRSADVRSCGQSSTVITNSNFISQV